jgi:hypothetical protein
MTFLDRESFKESITIDYTQDEPKKGYSLKILE